MSQESPSMESKTTLSQTTHSRAAIFNSEKFQQQLDNTDSFLSCFKDSINTARTILDDRFKAKDNIEGIIQDQAWFMDQILRFAWRLYDWDEADDISLLAVGGYGRGELHPYSDIDIQILLKKNNTQKYKTNIENFLTFLWDINLEIGQSVRTIKENKREAAQDLTIATALMESRTIIGNKALHSEVIELLAQGRIWAPKKFFIAKKDEQNNRHSKYNDIAYALEPNLKVAPGGLRDIQTIGWIAKRYFGASDFQELVEREFLQEAEYIDLIKGRNFLWELRYGLHMIAGKREDRLLFHHQRDLAHLFSYKDDKRSLAIEKLMQKYYRVVLTLRELNDVLLQLFDEEILRSKEKAKIKAINSRFQIHNNYIEAVHTRVFRETPSALIEIFVLYAENNKIEGIRAATIRLIRNGRQLIDDEFRKDINNNALFMKLLRSPHNMVARLRQMKRYGILSDYLPEFGKIVGKMQHDLFHIYTVDDHTLQVIENMRSLAKPEASQRFPLAAQVVKNLTKIELLYIAGLYHDIAKGRGGDHSLLGVKDAQKFCKQHSLEESDTNLITWLVKKHLSMSGVAQREDILDPDVIRNFALAVGDQIHLDYLYLLTVADINATNPNLWNTWRASLLKKLYLSTKRMLSQGLEKTVGKAVRIKENRNKALALLKVAGYSKTQIEAIWNNPVEDYFLRESVEDISWQTQGVIRHDAKTMPLVLIKNNQTSRYEGATQIFIYTKMSRFLFANIATAFDRLNMNIQDARIFNTDNEYCFTTFMVLEADGKLIDKKNQRIEEIRTTLQEYSQANASLESHLHTRASRKQRHFSRRTETTLNNPENMPYSILEVLCPDRPGLLAKVANIFVEMDILLHNAKITTLGENVEDVFFISTSKNKPLTNIKTIEKLQASIKRDLDNEIQPS